MTDALGITIQDVVKRFAGRTVLNGMTLTVNPGETMALIGPSGGGPHYYSSNAGAAPPFSS